MIASIPASLREIRGTCATAALLVLLACVLAPDAAARTDARRGEASLAEAIASVAPGDLLPGAERFGAPEGEPPMAPGLSRWHARGICLSEYGHGGRGGLFGKAHPHPHGDG